jgi:hypothetical protein
MAGVEEVKDPVTLDNPPPFTFQVLDDISQFIQGLDFIVANGGGFYSYFTRVADFSLCL